jgi:hypothetical protein
VAEVHARNEPGNLIVAKERSKQTVEICETLEPIVRASVHKCETGEPRLVVARYE